MALIKKVFDYSVWAIIVGFFLLAGIVYVNNQIYPGDNLYPFKLKFESFVLATSQILNKQVDFSIDLVIKRTNEVAKILTAKNSLETLGRLGTQVELTATSISQMSDPAEKKKAAEKYITKLNEVSSVLSEKQKEFVTTSSSTSITESEPTTQPLITQTVTQLPTIQPTTKSTTQSITQPPITRPTTQQPITQPTTTPEVEIATVSEQIDNTQQTIQQTINEMASLTKNSQQKNKHNSPKNNDFENMNDEEKNKINKDNDFNKKDDSKKN